MILLDVFVLKIALGNDAMRSAEDIADALNKTALKLAYTGECKTFGSVIDTNGNNVGGWEIQ